MGKTRVLVLLCLAGLSQALPPTLPPTTALPPKTPPTTLLPTTTPPTTTPDFTTKPRGCYDNGKFHPIGTEIKEGPCPKVCGIRGTWTYIDTFECIFGYKSTTPTPPPVTTIGPPRPRRCYYDGKWYWPDDVMETRQCYVMFCDKGIVRRLSLPCTTPPPPTTPPMHMHCYYSGRLYMNGESIPTADRCVYRDCHYGKIRRIVLPCTRPPGTPPLFTTKPQPPTTKPPPTRLTTIKPFGCYQNGRWYAPNEKISSGQSGNWCYGSYCSAGGQITHWDDFHCGKTTFPPTTVPPTTQPPKTTCGPSCQQYCYNREDGQLYPPGAEMSRHTTEIPGGTTCWRIFCGQYGRSVVTSCEGTTPFVVKSTFASPPTTTPPTTTPPTTTPPIKTTTPCGGTSCKPMCYNRQDGQYYPPGALMSRHTTDIPGGTHCYRLVCGNDGKPMVENCVQTTPFMTKTTPAPPKTTTCGGTSCKQYCYNKQDGQLYPPGAMMSRHTTDIPGGTHCYRLVCGDDGKPMMMNCVKTTPFMTKTTPPPTTPPPTTPPQTTPIPTTPPPMPIDDLE